jgi:minichromosome maintenance protein 10
MAHSAVQDFLYGRYYLTPTLLYSVIRLSRDGATFDLPVDGDWLTIAVVAERGEVKISGTKNTSNSTAQRPEEVRFQEERETGIQKETTSEIC